MRQLDHVAGGQVEPFEHLPLGVAGDKRAMAGELDQHDQRAVVLSLVAGLPTGRLRRQHREPPARAAHRLRGDAATHVGTGRGQARRKVVEGLGRLRGLRQQRGLDGDPPDEVVQPGHVVGVAVGEDEEIDAADRVATQRPPQAAAVRRR